MKRDILQDLLLWKQSVNRKPIILRGARQVGKTTVIHQLGQEFDNVVEINFEESPDAISFFANSLNPQEIVGFLENYFSVHIGDGSTLLFFDEVQMCPRAMLALRYFFEKRPKLHVIAAGSLIDFELQKISFPVGRVDFYYLYPLSFGEYLSALGKNNLRIQLNDGSDDGDDISVPTIPEGLHKQVCGLLRDYSIIGGMPQVVASYIEHRNLGMCQAIQNSIIETFLADFPSYAKKKDIKYLTTVWNAIPAQLGRKLTYTNVSRIYKSRELSDALDLLELAGLVKKVYHSSANGIPLAHEKNHKRFKVLFFDIGLAMRMLHVPIKKLLVNDDLCLINEGSLAEQLIGQELLAYSSCRERAQLYYWHREAKSSNAEVDYLLERKGRIIPIEVKAGCKGKARSLQQFIIEKKPNFSLCFSRERAAEKNKIYYMPLYQVEITRLNAGE